MPDDILTILADAPEVFQPLPPGVERHSYKHRTPEELENDLNHLYDINRLQWGEINRQRAAIILGNTKLKWLWRISAGAFTFALAAWTPLWLPLLMKLAGLK